MTRNCPLAVTRKGLFAFTWFLEPFACSTLPSRHMGYGKYWLVTIYLVVQCDSAWWEGGNGGS